MKNKLSLLALSLLATAAPSFAQLQRGEKPTAEQIQAGEAPAAPEPEAERAARELKAQMAALHWTRTAAQDLLTYVQQVAGEGLDSRDYAPERLATALAGTDDGLLSIAATDTFLRLSSDLALGHVRGDDRLAWHTPDTDIDAQQQYDMMQRAIAGTSVRDILNGLLPTHPQYAELKLLLARSPDPAVRNKVRANMDRWRWLPRDLGKRYIIVNVPAFTVALVEDGRVVARHNVVVGKPSTPTPQINAVATGVIFNPWWEVPTSIAGEVRGKKGYVTVKNGDKVRYRQPPGPSNALGQVKFVMPNNLAIYLHDTPSKSLFSRPVRAFSHGCIRTQNIVHLAQLLVNDPAWDRAAVNRVIASGKSTRVNATAPTPIYIAYFTAAAAANDAGLISYADIYGRDKPVLAALNDKPAGSTAAATVLADRAR
jgi:murein L,D-transpeptidase YcbB/YkuD